MIKTGVVQTGRTPSPVSGKPSQIIKSGEAVRRNEKAPASPEDLRGKIDIPELKP